MNNVADCEYIHLAVKRIFFRKAVLVAFLTCLKFLSMLQMRLEQLSMLQMRLEPLFESKML
jgi:hypothetical protein